MAKHKPTRELESFSPEVLAEFIRFNVPMLSAARVNKVFADLIHIEARQQIEKINEEVSRLIDKGKTLHGVEHLSEYLAVQDQIDVLWKEWDEASNIAYPRTPEKTNG